MQPISPEIDPDTGSEKPLGKKLLWFVGLWALSVLTITLIGGLLRWILL